MNECMYELLCMCVSMFYNHGSPRPPIPGICWVRDSSNPSPALDLELSRAPTEVASQPLTSGPLVCIWHLNLLSSY